MMLRVLCISLLACFALFAQGSVTIYGTVKDASGSVIPGVTVEVSNDATGAVRRASSDERGNYVVTQLPIGVYTLSAESAGFKKYVEKDIRVQVDDNRQVNVTFEVGAVTDSITVQAEAVQVDTRAGTLKEVVDSRRIVELPLNGRNPLQLQQLVPGSGGVTGRGQAQNDTYSINGSRTNSNNYVLDGGDNHDPYFNTPAVFPSPDALEEFSIQTNSYSAEFGRNAGALLNAVTKSGTNLFHGTVFEFLRNEKLNARNFFANNVPPFRRNQFGGTFGGPVQRDRTFFFFSYQGTRERSQPGSTTSTPPTAAERSGDFSASAKRINDPLTGQAFPGNIIPRSRLDGVAQNFLEAFVPAPNRADGLLSFSSGQKQDQDNVLGKVDHQFTAANRASVRWLHNWETFQEATGNLPGFFASIKYRNINISGTDTHIISPTLLNSFVFTFNDIDRRQLSVVPGNKNWSDFGSRIVRSFTAEGVPAGHDTNVQGRFQAFSRFPLNHFRRHYHAADRINWSKGAHFLKLGGEYRRSILDLQEFFQGDPQFTFNGQVTGDAMADFLLARPFRMQQIAELKNNPRAHEISAFFQDDWKISSRLTLNLGARWDPYLPFIDTGDRFGQLHPGRQSEQFPSAPVGMLYPGDEGVPRATIRRSLGNLAPRIGFAFDPTGSGSTSIRGGYGIFYSQVRQQAHNQPSNSQPFSLKLVVNTPPSLVDPYAVVGNPFPFKAPTTDAERAAFRFVRPLTVTQWDPNFSNAYAQQWNFNIQREVARAWLITAAYVGSKGTHLFNQTEANPAVYIPGRSTAGNTDSRRLYAPDFGAITDQSSTGNSIYHSGQLSLNKRFTQGFTVLAAYTFSKFIDDSSGDGDGPTNPLDLRNERGLSDLDITHRMVISYIWELPRLAGRPALVRHLAGGWETNGIVTLASGRVFTVTAGRDNSLIGVNADRADLVGDPHLDTGRPRGELVQRYFNTDAFAFNAQGTFGTAGRNILRGPGQASTDFGVLKNFSVTEKSRVQFRAEFFNLFNRVNLSNPNGNRNASNFGRITGAEAPRVIQLALKYSF